jgi:hypothetical protein
MTHVRLYADLERKAVVIEYDQVFGRTVAIVAVNTADGDVGNREAINNSTDEQRGTAVLSFPVDFIGEDEVTVTGSESGVSKGTIQIGL